jgi:Cytochrome C'
MTMRDCLLVGLLAVPVLSVLACGPPHRDLPPDQIEKLGDLGQVMDVQATVADPQFKKIGETTYGDADWAAFADTGNRLQSTSKKVLSFSKGPGFDALANQLHANAEKLSSAAAAKDAKAASDSLAAIKATCKECHSKFR